MKEEKRLQKEAEQAAREAGPLELRERIRNQWEALDVARRVLDSLDHSVRYGLIIFSAVNTAAVVLIVRPQLLSSLPPAALWVMRGLGGLYLLVALWILFYAIRSLSPRLAPHELARLKEQTDAHRTSSEDHILLMALRPVGAESSTLAAFHDGWRGLTGEELSRELSEAILISKHMMERKYAVLNRLYPALAVMLLLAAVLILVIAALPTA